MTNGQPLEAEKAAKAQQEHSWRNTAEKVIAVGAVTLGCVALGAALPVTATLAATTGLVLVGLDVATKGVEVKTAMAERQAAAAKPPAQTQTTSGQP